MMTSIKALIFDFDGLILDTETPAFQSWQEIYSDYDVILTPEKWMRFVGTGSSAIASSPFDELETLTGQHIDRHIVDTKRQEMFMRLMKSEHIRPGIKKVIAQAKSSGLKIGLASSASRKWILGNLERLELLADFECIRCADDADQVKPSPELYQLVLTAFGIGPEQAIAFEDSPNGIQSAKAAGVFCIAVPNTLTQAALLQMTDIHIESLAEFDLEQFTGTRFPIKIQQVLYNQKPP